VRQQLVHQYGAALLVGQAGVGVRPIAAPAAGRPPENRFDIAPLKAAEDVALYESKESGR